MYGAPMFTPIEIEVALARLEYGVPLTEFDRRVIDWATTILSEAEEAVIEDVLNPT